MTCLVLLNRCATIDLESTSTGFIMAGQFGLSPTSTLLDVKTALQNAIAQEEATISEAQQRVTHYQEQLASLAALVALPVDVPKLTDALTETKEPTAATDTSASNGASVAPTAAAKTTPKRTGGRSTKRTASKTAAKTTGNRTQTVAKTAPEPVVVETPSPAVPPSDAPVPAATTTATEPAELPKLVKAFRGKSLFEAVQMVLSGATEPLSAKAVTQKLYGKKQLEDEATSQRLTRLVTRQLVQGVSDLLFQREGDRPVLYRVASAPAPAAS